MWYILCWYFFFFFSFFFWCWKWIFVYVHRFWFLLSLSAVAGLLLLLVLMVFRFSIACAPLSIINAHGVMPACEWVDFRSEPHHTVHMHKINKVIANNNGSARAHTECVCVFLSWAKYEIRIRGPVTVYTLPTIQSTSTRWWYDAVKQLKMPRAQYVLCLCVYKAAIIIIIITKYHRQNRVHGHFTWELSDE